MIIDLCILIYRQLESYLQIIYEMKDQKINNIFSSFLIERKLNFDHDAIMHKCLYALKTSDDHNQKNIFHILDLFRIIPNLLISMNLQIQMILYVVSYVLDISLGVNYLFHK